MSTPAPAPAPAAGSSASAASGSPQSQRPRSGAESERRVRPRHFHAGPNPVAGSASSSNDGATAAVNVETDPPLPPAARLYRHALESIFAFLNRSELVTGLKVSHGWLAAVKSMASLQLNVSHVVAESAMGRHVIQLGVDKNFVQVIPDSRSIVARLMPQLRVLYCQLELSPAQGPLTFPPALRVLNVEISGPEPENVNGALEVIGRLQLLETFIVQLFDFDEQLSFAPLASLPLLRDLDIIQLADDNAQPAVLSHAQVAQLRAMPLLEALGVQPMSTLLLRRLLAQPHELQWQAIRLPDDEAAALLPQLPSLAVLGDLSAYATCLRFDFLRRLPNLTHVYLRISEPSVAGRIKSLVARLQCCNQIEDLDLSSAELTAGHFAELLPRLPRLDALTLSQLDIDSLSFLAQEPMVPQLTFLQLIDCARPPLTELRHVHALQGLKELRLIKSFDVRMDPLSQSLHTPPSALMPHLCTFFYSPPVGADVNAIEVDEDGEDEDDGDEVAIGEDEHGDDEGGADEVAADAEEGGE